MVRLYSKGVKYTNEKPVPKGEWRKIYKEKNGGLFVIVKNKKRHIPRYYDQIKH